MGGSSKQTVGYRYYLGMQMGLCHGPVDNVNEIQVDRRIAWAGINTGGAINVDAPSLFGGDKREGGVSGIVSIDMGLPAQTPNAYLKSQLGEEIPASRGVLCAVLQQCYVGNNPYLKPWAFQANRNLTISGGEDQWYPSKAQLNPTEIIGTNCQFACDSIKTFGQNNFENFWPMDDPSVSSTVPSQFRRLVGIFGLEPSTGVGNSWAGGGLHQEWSPDSSTGTLELCNGFESQYRHSYASTQKLDFTGYSSGDDMRGFYHTAIVTAASSGADYIIGVRQQWGRGASYSAFDLNPRVTVQVNEVDNEVRFTSSIDGSTPSITVSFAEVVPAHVITVFFAAPSWVQDLTALPDEKYYLEFQHLCFVDGAPAGTLTHRTQSYLVTPAFGPPSLNATDLFEAARSGTTSWLGLGLDFLTNNHSGAWSALQANFSDFDATVAGIEGCSATCADCNPAHIIRECLTDDTWGMGYLESDIDDEALRVAADQLAIESMGISILWDRETTLEEFIGEILRHIDAVLYVSRETGKFVLKLIRDDADSNTITLDESNVSGVSSAKRPTISELTNAVSVVYLDRETDENASVTLHNEALRQIQGVGISTTIQYPGFSDRAIATKAAERDLKALSTPLLSCEVVASRQAANLNIGDVFYLDWPDLNVNRTLMRINQIDYGDGRDNSVSITCVQDVFDTPVDAIQAETPEVWVDPTTVLPEASVARLVTETPYYVLTQQLGETQSNDILADDSDASFLLVSGGRQGTEFNANVLVNSGSGFTDSAEMDFHPYAYITEEVSQTDTELSISGGVDLDLVSAGTIAQIEEELVRVDSVNQDSIGAYVSVTVGRGILDTTPKRHLLEDSNGIFIKFWQDFAVSDDVQYASGEQLSVQIQTARGNALLSSPPTDEVTMASRAIRPYPPGNLQIDGLSYPEPYVWTADHTLTWAHRDRLQQTDGNLYAHQTGDIGPEAGVTYRVEGYAYVDDSTVEEQFVSTNVGTMTEWGLDSNLAAVDSNYPPDNARTIVFKVWSVRDGYDSWQAAEVKLQVPPFTDSAGFDSTGAIDSVGFDSVGFTPDQLANLELWLDASDSSTITETSGTVTQWDDKSGNGYTFSSVSNGPATGSTSQNGLNTLDFDSSAVERLVCDQAATNWAFMNNGTTFNVYAVVKNGETSNPDSLAGFISTGNVSSGVRGFDLFFDDRTAQGFNDRLRVIVSSGAGSAPVDANYPDDSFPSNTFGVIAAEVDPNNSPAADRCRIRINGGSNQTANVSTSSVDGNAPANTLTIGRTGSGNFPFDGQIAEIVIYAGDQTEGERDQVINYLSDKWGI